MLDRPDQNVFANLDTLEPPRYVFSKPNTPLPTKDLCISDLQLQPPLCPKKDHLWPLLAAAWYSTSPHRWAPERSSGSAGSACSACSASVRVSLPQTSAGKVNPETKTDPPGSFFSSPKEKATKKRKHQKHQTSNASFIAPARRDCPGHKDDSWNPDTHSTPVSRRGKMSCYF